MAKIFEKRVEQNDIENGGRGLQLPSGTNFNNSSHIKVRDHETNETLSLYIKKATGRSFLGGEDWDRIVASKDITKGFRIEVYEDDSGDPEAPPYKIIVKPPPGS